jgi:hypothetical protein
VAADQSAVRTYPRRARGHVEEALTDTPVVLIQGARQVGKSTLATEVLTERGIPLLTLDSSVVLNAAQEDPDSFGLPSSCVPSRPWWMRIADQDSSS